MRVIGEEIPVKKAYKYDSNACETAEEALARVLPRLLKEEKAAHLADSLRERVVAAYATEDVHTVGVSLYYQPTTSRYDLFVTVKTNAEVRHHAAYIRASNEAARGN